MMANDDTISASTARQDRLDLQTVLRTMEGRRFIRRVLTEAGIYEFTPHGIDPQALAYKAGQRDMGLLIIAMVTDADPRSFVQLTQEAAAELERAQRQQEGDPDV